MKFDICNSNIHCYSILSISPLVDLLKKAKPCKQAVNMLTKLIRFKALKLNQDIVSTSV